MSVWTKDSAEGLSAASSGQPHLSQSALNVLRPRTTAQAHAQQVLASKLSEEELNQLQGFVLAFWETGNTPNLVRGVASVLDSKKKLKLLPYVSVVADIATSSSQSAPASPQSVSGGSQARAHFERAVAKASARLRAEGPSSSKDSPISRQRHVHKSASDDTSSTSSRSRRSFRLSLRRRAKTMPNHSKRVRSQSQSDSSSAPRSTSGSLRSDILVVDPSSAHGTQPDSQDSNTLQLTIRRSSSKEPFGFNLRGGEEYGLGLIVSRVDQHVTEGSIKGGGTLEPASTLPRDPRSRKNVGKPSPAYAAGLRVGDQLMKINGKDVVSYSHDQAVSLIRGMKKVKLQVKRLGFVPDHKNHGETFTWLDVQSNTVTASAAQPDSDADFRRVNITVDQRGLGMSVRGGRDQGTGLYVSMVVPGSVSEQAGLKVGDQIFDINGQDVDSLSHADAVERLTSYRHVFLTVRASKQVPSHRFVYEATEWKSQDARVGEASNRSRSGGGRHSPTSRSQRSQLSSARNANAGHSHRAPEQRTASDTAHRAMSPTMSTNSFRSRSINSFFSLVQDRVQDLLCLIDDELDRERLNLAVAAYRSASASSKHLGQTLCSVLAPIKDERRQQQEPLVNAIRGILPPSELTVFDEVLFADLQRQQEAVGAAGSTETMASSTASSTGNNPSISIEHEEEDNLDFLDDAVAAVQAMVEDGRAEGSSEAAANQSVLPKGFTQRDIRSRPVHVFVVDKSTAPLGLTIEGGCDTKRPEMGIRVKDFRSEGAIGIDGRVIVGDEILQVNDASVANLTHEEVIDVFVAALEKQDRCMSLTVARES